MTNTTYPTNKTNPSSNEVGYVISSRDFLALLDGLPTIQLEDIVENEEGVRGMVYTLSPNQVSVLILDEGSVTPGQLFHRTGERLSVSVGPFLLGRAVNPLGVPIDGKGLLSKTATTTKLPLEQPAPGINARQFIQEQFSSGLTIIDTLIPLGKGQRELVMGDGHAGKTSFLINLVVNQKQTETICIYTIIGKPTTAIRTIIDVLRANDALAHTVVIASSSTEPTPLIFLTPKVAFTVAEYFQRQGKDVLVILDDMGTHAKIYREISLLLGRAPGRESYPGDIFYQHAHLMERAGKFKDEFGGGSITALPVIELNLSDFTTFIPTNLMSITDGHLLFRSSLHNKGQRPAIDLSLSVSRVGRQTQGVVQNLLSRRLRQVLAQAEELETVSRFSSELPAETQLILHQKGMIEEMMKQDMLTSIPKEVQVAVLGLVFTSFLHDKDSDFIRKYKDKLVQTFTNDPKIVSSVTSRITTMQSDQELIQALEKVVPELKEICQ